MERVHLFTESISMKWYNSLLSQSIVYTQEEVIKVAKIPLRFASDSL